MNLFQGAAGSPAQAGAGAPQIVWREIPQLEVAGVFAHDPPGQEGPFREYSERRLSHASDVRLLEGPPARLLLPGGENPLIMACADLPFDSMVREG